MKPNKNLTEANHFEVTVVFGANIAERRFTPAWRIGLASVILLVFGIVGARPLLAQQKPTGQEEQTDVIKVKTDLIQVRAVVTDKSGKIISGLKQDDFEILENGKPQTASFFSEERILSVNAPSPATVHQQSTVGTATPTGATVRPARTIVLFVDTLHLSVLSLLRVKQQLKQYVDEQVTDQDIVEIVTTASSLGVLEQFMRDRKMLKYAIDKIAGFQKTTSYYTPYIAAEVLNQDTQALSVAMRIVAHEDFADYPPPDLQDITIARARTIIAEETVARRSTWQILKAVCEQMASMPGERVIAFVSDGFTMLDGGMGADTQDLTEATSKAVKAGVVVNTFFPQGLTTPAEYSAASPYGDRMFGAVMSAERMDEQNTLRYLADDTGGEAYLNSSDVVSEFKKMLDSNSDYYALGYYPQDDPKKSFRNIKIQVKNHPEYKIRTQKGYQPSSEKSADVATTPQEKLFQAMIAELPLNAIAVTSTASFLERGDDDAQISLQVHFDGASLEYPAKDDMFGLSCELAVAVFDSSGKMSTNFEDGVNAVYKKDDVEKAKQKGFRYDKRIKLAPGLYQIRIGVRDVNGGQIGTSQSWVTVPNLSNKKLALSSLVLGKRQLDLAKPDAANEAGGAVIKPVTGTASLKIGEPIFYHFVVYNVPSDVQQAAGLTLKVEVLLSGKTVYDGPWQPAEQRVVRKGSSGMEEVGGQLKMGVEPGIYTLRVTVKDPKSKQSSQQTIDIELES